MCACLCLCLTRLCFGFIPRFFLAYETLALQGWVLMLVLNAILNLLLIFSKHTGHHFVSAGLKCWLNLIFLCVCA